MNQEQGIWQRDGRNIEDLPDPFAPVPPTIDDGGEDGPKRRWRWRYFFYGLFALFVALFLWLVFTAPLGRSLEPLDDPALLLVSEEGQPIARRGAMKGEPVEVAKLDPNTPNAFIAIEDRRFRSHLGIDPRAIGRAMVANMEAGGVRQGGSTITQQLAKTSFLSSDRSLKRKAQEVIIAFWLEAWLTKDEILSRYMSSIYFGDGVYGLRAAARHYFDRDPEDLTLAQSAMLAGLVQGPSRLAPTRHLERAQKRSRVVLQEMADNGFISEAEARSTRSARPTGRRMNVPTGTYFADWVIPQAREQFDRHYGEKRVETTLDADLQRVAVRAISNARLGDAQAALVAMRPTGEVVAMIGGRSYAKSAFNRATQAKRQPGSAFKMFVYLAAFQSGYKPDDLIDDSPITIEGWTPANNDGQYRGEITLREAFARSSNAATVRLSERVGRDNVRRVARALGVRSDITSNPSLALGTSGMSLVELTGAYAALASGRYPVRPTGLPRTPEEESAWSRLTGGGGQLNPNRDWQPMLDLLWHSVNEGTGRNASLWVPTYGKTGTTQDNRDAIFVGFAGNLVVGVWVGNDDDSSLGKVTGGTLPARIWKNFMNGALAIDGRARVDLPYKPRRQRELPKPENESPIPEDWIDAPAIIREIADALEGLFDE